MVPKIMKKSYKNDVEKSSNNHRKSSPTPPKIEAKKLLNGLQKQVRIKSQQRGATGRFLGAIFSDFEPSWLPRSPSWRPKRDEHFYKRCEKQRIFEGLLESPNLEKSSILTTNWEASWLQNPSKIDVVCERRIFAKSIPGCSQGLFF